MTDEMKEPDAAQLLEGLIELVRRLGDEEEDLTTPGATWIDAHGVARPEVVWTDEHWAYVRGVASAQIQFLIEHLRTVHGEKP